MFYLVLYLSLNGTTFSPHEALLKDIFFLQIILNLGFSLMGNIFTNPQN